MRSMSKIIVALRDFYLKIRRKDVGHISVLIRSPREASQKLCPLHMDILNKCHFFDANPDANGQKMP